MSTFHFTFSTRGREPVAAGESARRSVVRTILRVAGKHVVLFCVVDDHIHVVVLCDEPAARRLARDLLFAIRAHTSAVVEPAHIRPVTTRAHMEWLVSYVLGQVDRHGLDAHPALWSGSCFAEIAGVRAIPGWRRNIREALPRFRGRDAFAAVGLCAAAEPATDETVRALGASRLVDAAAFAAGAPPGLAGNVPNVTAARCAVAHLGGAARIGHRDLSHALGVEVAQVGRLAARHAPDRLVRATRLRLSLEEQVREVSVRAAAAK